MQIPFLELLQGTLTKDQFNALCEVIINVYNEIFQSAIIMLRNCFPSKEVFKRSICRKIFVPIPQEKDTDIKTRHHT